MLTEDAGIWKAQDMRDWIRGEGARVIEVLSIECPEVKSRDS